MTTNNVLIIGAGRIGHTIAELIRDGQAETDIQLWDKNPNVVQHQQPLGPLVNAAEVIFCCAPSWAVRNIFTNILPDLRPSTIIITLAKGCEGVTGKTMHEVAEETLPATQPHAILGGPMLAETLQSGHRGVGVVASRSVEIFEHIQPLFSGTTLEIIDHRDSNEVALAGVLKNIYAFIVGVGVGLAWSDDQQRSYFSRARQEFLEVGLALKISAATIEGPAGLGDFMETATSPMSHNRTCGQNIGRSEKLSSNCEATISLPAILNRLGKKHFPLLGKLSAVLHQGQSPKVFKELFS